MLSDADMPFAKLPPTTGPTAFIEQWMKSPSAHQSLALPDDLESAPCIVMTGAQNPTRWVYLEGERRTVVPVRPIVELSNYSAVAQAAILGAGVGRLPLFLIGQHLKSGSLVEVLSDFTLPMSRFHALYAESGRGSPRINAFLDVVHQVLSREPKALDRPQRD